MEYNRSQLYLGEKALSTLKSKKVAVLGIGGVGGYACEALARSGVGSIVVVDFARVSESNLNRQIIATYDTIGLKKVDVMKQRIASFNKDVEVICIDAFFTMDVASMLVDVDFMIDAMDTISAKVDCMEFCSKNSISMISSMGMANRSDPLQLIVTTLNKTSHCALAKAVRRVAKERGIPLSIPVVLSMEEPFSFEKVDLCDKTISKERFPLASMIFTPAACGLTLAKVAIDSLLKEEFNE